LNASLYKLPWTEALATKSKAGKYGDAQAGGGAVRMMLFGKYTLISEGVRRSLRTKTVLCRAIAPLARL
jgi:hypothetical protein